MEGLPFVVVPYGGCVVGEETTARDNSGAVHGNGGAAAFEG
jgi:hypothetical protein